LTTGEHCARQKAACATDLAARQKIANSSAAEARRSADRPKASRKP